jgi:hypothetical protein
MAKNNRFICWYSNIKLFHPNDADTPLKRESIILNELIISDSVIFDHLGPDPKTRNMVKAAKIFKNLMANCPVAIKYNFKVKLHNYLKGRTFLEEQDIEQASVIKRQIYLNYKIKLHDLPKNKIWWINPDPKFSMLFQKERNTILTNFGVDISTIEYNPPKFNSSYTDYDDDNIGNRIIPDIEIDDNIGNH